MSKDLNVAMFTGRLGADPELRYTGDGSAIATFRIASNRTRRDQRTGQNVEETEWIRVVAWAALAEECNNLLRKSTRVYVEGRIQTRREGDPVRYVVELIASEVLVFSDAAETQPAAAPPPAAETQPAAAPPPPATAAEAERRFYVRYGEQIGGADWRTVQIYLGRRIAPPETVEEWMTVARAVRDAGEKAHRPAAQPNYSPGAQAAAARRRA